MLEEKPTLMAELISTLLSILDANYELDERTALMLRVSTLISRHLTATLKEVTSTRSKMEMLLLGGSENLQHVEALNQKISSVKSSWLRLERSFGKCYVVWLHDFYSPTSIHSRHMPTGTIEWIRSHIDMTHSMYSTLLDILSSINGLRSTLTGTQV